MKVGKRRISQVLPPTEGDDVCTKKYAEEHFLPKTVLSVDESRHPPTIQEHNRRLINLAQPTDAQDAVTLSYMQTTLTTALRAMKPVTLFTIESLYPHPPLNSKLPGKWYMLPTGRNKFEIPCDGTLVLRSAAPLLIHLAVYIDVVDYSKLPPQLKLKMDTPFQVRKGQTFAFRLTEESPSAHMDDFHLYLLFEYRMELPMIESAASRPFV